MHLGWNLTEALVAISAGLLAGSVNAWNQKLDKGGEAAAGFPRLAKAYELSGAPSAILIDGAGDAGEVARFLGSRLKY